MSDEWQPIETAPKDGRDILAYHPKGFMHVIHWDKRDHRWAVSKRKYGIILSGAMHWMSLPAPPKTVDSREH